MRILIADDNMVELEFIKTVLSQERDVEIVGEAQNGREAYNLIIKLKPDVVFLDISMPGFSGIELAKKLKEDLFIVFITGHPEHALTAFNLGSIDYITKPFTSNRLKLSIRRIRKLLNSKPLKPTVINLKCKGIV